MKPSYDGHGYPDLHRLDCCVASCHRLLHLGCLGDFHSSVGLQSGHSGCREKIQKDLMIMKIIIVKKLNLKSVLYKNQSGKMTMRTLADLEDTLIIVY